MTTRTTAIVLGALLAAALPATAGAEHDAGQSGQSHGAAPFTTLDRQMTTVYPTSPADYALCGDHPDARAGIRAVQFEGLRPHTRVTITVRDAKPNHYYTAWVRLEGTSPLTNGAATALAPSRAIRKLMRVTPAAVLVPPYDAHGDDGTGGSGEINGFTTDAAGDGVLRVRLDYALLGGSYPFHRFNRSFDPVPITGAGAERRVVSIVSHCGSPGNGHGLVSKTPSDPAQGWFDLPAPA